MSVFVQTIAGLAVENYDVQLRHYCIQAEYIIGLTV
jgi:hypothetical protein